MHFAFARLSFLGIENKRTKHRIRRGKFRPRLELLEDRTLLSPSGLILSVNPATISENDTTTLSGSFTATGVLADSVHDFSFTQGQGNWYYGYYTTPGVSSTFTQMQYTTSNFGGFAGPAWEESPSQPPWTAIWAGGAHPTGPNDGAVHWPVRRWQSTVNGTINISGTVGDSGNPFFNVDGLSCNILVNGTQVFSQHMNAGTQQSYSITATVAVGSFIDFAIDPGQTDYSDHGVFTATLGEQLPQPYTAAINWGDGLSDTVNIPSGSLSFSVSHHY